MKFCMSVFIWCVCVDVCVCACACPTQTFVCAELTHCRYHPESVQYPGMALEKGWHGAGLYPCCSQRVLRFDPSGLPKVTHTHTHTHMHTHTCTRAYVHKSQLYTNVCKEHEV